MQVHEANIKDKGGFAQRLVQAHMQAQKNPARKQAGFSKRDIPDVLCVCSNLYSNAGFVACTFCIDVTINELDDRHRSHVTITETGF